MKEKTQLTRQQKLFGVLLKSQVKFMRWFWQDELTLPPSTRQKLFWNDLSDRILLATGRKTAKTIFEEARLIRSALVYRGNAVDERMFVTPGENQLSPVQSRLLSKINNVPLFRMMKSEYNKNEGVLGFHTRAVIRFRIDGSDGTDRNMVGLRLSEIIGDEMQLTNAVTHKSRMQSALPHCKWVYSGVPNGVRHTPFWKLDQSKEGKNWSHHKFSTFVNPLYWPDGVRNTLIEDYTRGSQDFITQVMGGWGEELFSSFPPGSIAVDERLPYRVVKIQGGDIPLEYDAVTMARMAARLNLPNPKDVYQFVLGMDYGFLQDPTEIGVAYRTAKDGEQGNVWKMLCRIEVQGAHPQAQARLLRYIAWILGEQKIAKVVLDQQHAGIAVAGALLELPDMGVWWAKKLMDFNSNGIVELVPTSPDEEAEEGKPRIHTPLPPKEQRRKLPPGTKKVRRKQYFTQQLQAALLSAKANLPANIKLWLGNDPELIQELVDTREKKTEAGNIVYVPRHEGAHRPIDHSTDCLRCIICAAFEAHALDQGEDEGEWEEAVGWLEEPLFAGQRDSVALPKERKDPWDTYKVSVRQNF